MEIFTYIIIALVGLCVGSFLNVVIYRVPNKMSIIKPASHCTKCNASIKWYDNIPILSYIILGGKCRNCKTHISFRYTLVEILNTLFWLASALLFWKTSIVYAIIVMLTSSILLVVACIDFENLYIPDRFQIILLALGILACVFTQNITVWNHIIGMFVGGGIMLAFYGLGYLLFKKEAMGLGDVKLMAVCGLILGWQNIIFAIFVGAIVGAICLLLLQSKTKEEGKEYPFAPFLAFGSLIALFLGEYIINFYCTIFC